MQFAFSKFVINIPKFLFLSTIFYKKQADYTLFPDKPAYLIVLKCYFCLKFYLPKSHL